MKGAVETEDSNRADWRLRTIGLLPAARAGRVARGGSVKKYMNDWDSGWSQHWTKLSRRMDRHRREWLWHGYSLSLAHWQVIAGANFIEELMDFLGIGAAALLIQNRFGVS
jgi:hypothetical protein